MNNTTHQGRAQWNPFNPRKIQILLLLFPFFSSAQVVSKQIIKSDIDEVKLYLTAGEISRQQDVSLEKGRNKLIFSGISTYADPQSIQFTGEGDFKLVSVSTEMDFLAAEEFNPRISILNDSLEVLKDKHQDLEDELNAYYAEQAVLNTNRNISGKDASLSVEQIRAAADFFRERTLKINRKISSLRKDQRVNTGSLEDTRYQLIELNYNENQRSNQVIILIDSENAKSMNTQLKYIVSDCGWAATYDLSADDLSQKINLKYKAKVYNNTGNEWKNVDLFLSTSDPQLSASHPELSPWYLSASAYHLGNKKAKYYAPQANRDDYREGAVSNLNIANQRAYDNYMLNEDKESSGKISSGFTRAEVQQVSNLPKVQMQQIEISELSTEFEIASKFSCPADAKPYMVDVKEMNLEATFSHITVPKLDRSVFLMANIVGWQELELIPGPTNVYFGGQYVGVSRIDTRNVSDTLSLSFGRDSKVMVVRKLLSEMSTKKVIGSSKKDAYRFDITVRNNRKTPVNVRIYDQVPISTSSDITIYDDILSGGEKSPTTGEVIWNIKLAPNQGESKVIGYTVKYPKNLHVSVKRFRTVSAPSF